MSEIYSMKRKDGLKGKKERIMLGENRQFTVSPSVCLVESPRSIAEGVCRTLANSAQLCT